MGPAMLVDEACVENKLQQMSTEVHFQFNFNESLS